MNATKMKSNNILVSPTMFYVWDTLAGLVYILAAIGFAIAGSLAVLFMLLLWPVWWPLMVLGDRRRKGHLHEV